MVRVLSQGVGACNARTREVSVSKQFNLPSHAELASFMDLIQPNLFGHEYVILAKDARELVLCDVRQRAADGTVLHARVLPIN